MHGASLLLLLFATQHYILPVFGNVRGGDDTWTSRASMANWSSDPVEITVHAYPIQGAVSDKTHTLRGNDVLLLPGDAPEVGAPFLGAIDLESSDILFSLGAGIQGGRGGKTIPIARNWIPAGARSSFDGIYSIPSLSRANLFVTNPNDVPIEVRYSVYTPIGRNYPGQVIPEPKVIAAVVQPRSTAIMPLTCAGTPGYAYIDTIRCRADVSSDARYYAIIAQLHQTTWYLIEPNVTY